MCQALKKTLQKLDAQHRIAFVNLAWREYEPEERFGLVPFDVGMLRIHAGEEFLHACSARNVY
jgi:hypothetical protein